MAKLGFSYLPRPILNYKTNLKEEIFTPYIPIRISVSHGNPTPLIDALVDSGSDGNLFPLKLGELLGINFKKISPKIIYGIGNSKIQAYPAKVNIWINNVKYETEADFNLEQQTLLLGRQGFFDLFKAVIFDERARFLYVETL